MFTTVLGLAAVAGSLVNAAPVAPRAQPSDYYTPYLEPYDTYHLRYLALDCQDQHNTTFFEDCCHPLLSTQKLADRPAQCTPNDTEIASASSYIASTSLYGAPTTTVDAGDNTPAATTAAAATTTSSIDDGAEYSAAAASATESATNGPTTEAAIAQATTTTSSTQEAAPTSSASSGGHSGGNVNTGGYATYFYQGGNPGACGQYHSDSDYIIAIDQAWWGGSFGQTSQYCGRSITIQNTQNGKEVTATVADVCPTCANGNSLDLSVGAFTAIASESDGQVPINWWFS